MIASGHTGDSVSDVQIYTGPTAAQAADAIQNGGAPLSTMPKSDADIKTGAEN